MNEKINKLWDQAWDDNTPLSIIKEKFAELLNQEYAEDLRKLYEGERVVLPKDREHARAMVRVGMHYLEQNNVLS